jgi:OOP family OmpA-OmpF porin
LDNEQSWRARVLVAGLSAVVMGLSALPAGAQVASGDAVAPVGAGQVVVAGTVPDEATHQAVLARLQALYGPGRVVDQMQLGPVVAPPQWSQYVEKLLSNDVRQVSHGQLTIQGNNIDLRGEVANEALRQQIASNMAQALNPTYTVRNGLRVAVQEQALVDQAVANRIIEFEPGSAVLRPEAWPILDELAAAMGRLKGRHFEVIGHTDALGSRAGNVSLSLARAQAVKRYLVGKGVPSEAVATSGMGPDQPVASNDTEAGRARNRRIEFRVGT